MALIHCPECKREVSDKAPTCPNCGAPIAPQPSAPIVVQQAPAKKLIGPAGIGCAVLLALFFIFYIIGEVNKSGPPPDRNAEALRNVSLVNFEWHKGGFDNVMMVSFSIKNDNSFAVKDLAINCAHQGKSGTLIDSNQRTIFDVIPPKSMKKFRNFNMGFIHTQADSSTCRVISLVAVP